MDTCYCTYYYYYRLQTNCGKVIFSQVCVIHSAHTWRGIRGGGWYRGGCLSGGVCPEGSVHSPNTVNWPVADPGFP